MADDARKNAPDHLYEAAAVHALDVAARYENPQLARAVDAAINAAWPLGIAHGIEQAADQVAAMPAGTSAAVIVERLKAAAVTVREEFLADASESVRESLREAAALDDQD